MSSEEAQVKLFYSSLSSKTISEQNRIEQILDAKRIAYEKVDIASSEDAKTKMREIMDGRPGGAPQIANGDVYCGTCADLISANETDELYEFLKLPAPQKKEEAS